MFHATLRRLILADCSVAFLLSVGISQGIAQEEGGAKGGGTAPTPCPKSLCPPGSAAAPKPPKPTPIPPSPEFADPPILDTKPDKNTAKPKAFQKKLLQTNPLLRPPFAGQPVDSLKGMASGIKAVELDAPNRILAAQFLGTVDCATYPQAQEMLVQTMQEDPIEDVRYEAVLSLRLLLSRNCSNLDTECKCESCLARKQIADETTKHAAKAKKNHEKPKVLNPDLLDRKRFKPIKATPQESRYDCCRGCCNDKVMNALAKVAYDADEFGCCVEPSERVRNAAMMGLWLCQCEPAPMDYGVPSAPPVRDNEKEKEEVDQTKQKEETTKEKEESNPAKDNNSTKVTRPVHQVSSAKPIGTPANDQPKTLRALGDYCIVGLKSRQFEQVKPQFSSEVGVRTSNSIETRTYFFSSAEAKAEFDQNPTDYVPAYGGVDPVELVESGTKIEGQFLRDYEGRFYLFSTKENWEKFKATPTRYQVTKRK